LGQQVEEPDDPDVQHGEFFVTKARALSPVVLLLPLLLGAPASPGPEAAPPASAHLTVPVTAGAEATSARPYVAVVEETSLWSAPAREAVLDEGETEVDWALPPGRYRVVAGAPGYTVEYGAGFELPAAAAHTERVDLAPLVAVEGRVTDEQGGAIAGATISDLRQLVFGFAKRLTPLGEAHLRANFETVSDEDGAFQVLLHPQAGHYLVVGAQNRTPRFFANLRAGAAEAILREVALAPGSSLEVRWPEAADPAPYDRVQLVPAPGTTVSGLDLPAVLAVWARPVGGAPGPTAARWHSLPPGRYELWLKAPRHGAHDLVPHPLATVELAPGQHRDLDISLPKAEVAGTAPSAAGAPALLLLSAPLPERELESLRVHAWRGEAPEEAPFTAKAVSGGLLLEVAGGCRPDGLLVLTSESRVGAVSLGSATRCAEARSVELFPRADVTARLAAPPGAELPGSARLTATPCVAVAGDPVMELAARISDGGRLSVPVRADCVDLTARVGDFAPVTWAGLDLEPGQTRELGSQRLLHGAAVLARVLSSVDGRPLDGVAVSVVERERASAALRGGAETATGLPSGVTRQGGWVRLYGLPPGRDLVVLLWGEGRRVPHPAADLVLAENEERVLDALELPPPTELTVEIKVSPRLEEIEAVPYKVYLRAIDPGAIDLGLSRDVGPDRVVRFEDLPAGRWRLEGIARIEDGKPFPAASAALELVSGEKRTFVLELADSLYRGRVTYEGLPVEGSLSVTPVSPADRRGMNVRLSSEGEFRLPLEGPGTYTVQVFDARDDRFSDATIPEVRFEDPEETVQVQVPEGRLAGHLITADGDPVPDARVEVRSRQDLEGGRFLETRRFRSADPSGSFAIQGLTPGAWTVAAKANELESDPRVVQLGPDERVESLELVLEPAGRVSGTVYDGFGRPVPGARLLVTPYPGSSAELVPVLRTETDPLGRFELSTSSGERLANLEVITPAGTAAAFRSRLQPDMEVQLPPMGGPLLLDLPCGQRRTWISGAYFLVDDAGAYLPVPTLGSAERSSEGPCRLLREIPGIGVGAWRIVEVRALAQDALLMMGQGILLEHLEELASWPGAMNRVTVKPESL
jgi:hypothetical protein